MAPAETGGPRGLDGVHSQPLSPSGETCLHQAAALGQRTICHYIVEAGASLMKTDQQVSRGTGRARRNPRRHRATLPQTPPVGEGAPGEGSLRGFRAGLQHSPDPKPEPEGGGSSRGKRPVF